MLEDTVIYIKQPDREAQKKLPLPLLGRALRSYQTDDGSCMTVFGGEAFFTADADVPLLKKLVEEGSVQIILDLACHMQNDAVCKSFEIPKALLKLAAELQATFTVSIYVVAD